MPLFVTGHGSKLVPRAPFILSFFPPKLAIESGGKAVFFGPAGSGLGFGPKGNARVEDVTLEISEYPNVPVYSVHTCDFAFPVTDGARMFSCPDGASHSFELALEGATDDNEMVWIEGPLAGTLDLENATRNFEVLGIGTIEKPDGDVRWREYQYDVGQTRWRKRLYAVTLASRKHFGKDHHFALSAQAPLSRGPELFACADRIARGMSSEDWRSDAG